jgi:hypothetical protein
MSQQIITNQKWAVASFILSFKSHRKILNLYIDTFPPCAIIKKRFFISNK